LSASTTANAHLWPDSPVGEARSLIEQGKPNDATSLLQALIDEGRGGLLARTALVDALIALNDEQGALHIAREAVALYPNVAAAIVSLGDALIAANGLPAAIAEYQRALRLDPVNTGARYRAGCAWLEAGEPEKALQEFAHIESAEAPPQMQGKVAQAEAMRIAPRSNPNYVRHLFDQFSCDYDARMLAQLKYCAPAVLRELASLVMPGISANSLVVLDLGCGTGLTGEAFRDMAVRLNGIDLSPAMLMKARERGIYSELTVGDIEQFLRTQTGRYDLIVAGDTLVYLGNLERVFSGAAAGLAPNGQFLFTVECGEAADFELGPKRRWCHSEAYLRRLASEHNFAVTGLMPCHPRTESGVPVNGLAVALAKLN